MTGKPAKSQIHFSKYQKKFKSKDISPHEYELLHVVAVANSQHLIVQLSMILINIARYAMQSPFEVLMQSEGPSVCWPYGSTSRSGGWSKGCSFLPRQTSSSGAGYRMVQYMPKSCYAVFFQGAVSSSSWKLNWRSWAPHRN